MAMLRIQLMVFLGLCYGGAYLVHGSQTKAERTTAANIKLVGEEIIDAGVFFIVEFTAFHCSALHVCKDYRYTVYVYDRESEDYSVGTVRGTRGDILTMKTPTPLPQQAENFNYSVRVCVIVGTSGQSCTAYLTFNRRAAGLTQKVESISLTSTTLSWNNPSNASYFNVNWESNGGILCNGQFLKKEASQNVHGSMYTLEELSPATSWKVSVSSFSESRKKMFTSIIHFSTKGVVFNRVTDTTAIVHFLSPACPGSARTRMHMYNLTVGLRSYSSRCVTGKLCVVDVSGLDPLTEYSVRVLSVEGEAPLMTATFATTGDTLPQSVIITDNNSLTWVNPYSTEDVRTNTDDLIYAVSCSSGTGVSEEGRVLLKDRMFPLQQRGVFYKCSMLMSRGLLTAKSSHEYESWAVSEAVKKSFSLPVDGIQYDKGSTVITVRVPQLVQDGVSVSLYNVTVAASPVGRSTGEIDQTHSDTSRGGICDFHTYTAVRLLKHQVYLSTTVIVGDGTTVNGVYNRPLPSSCRLFIGVTVADMRGDAVFTDVYSSVLISDVVPVVANTSPDVKHVVIGIVCFILAMLALFTVGFFWRKHRLATVPEPEEDVELPVFPRESASECTHPLQPRSPQAVETAPPVFPRQRLTPTDQAQRGHRQPSPARFQHFNSGARKPHSQTASVSRRVEANRHRNTSPTPCDWNGSGKGEQEALDQPQIV